MTAPTQGPMPKYPQDEADETDDILANLEKQAQDIMRGRDPCSPFEWRLANALACLIATVRHDRKSR